MISIIIQFFNRRKSVKKILDIYSKYSTELEIIVNNDSKSDSDLFESYPNINVIYSENIGELRGYQFLSELTKNPYIVFHQDDDIPPKNEIWIEKSIQCLEKDPKLVAIKIGHGPKLNNLIYKHIITFGPPWIVKKENFYNIGGFDLRMSDVGDGCWRSDTAFSVNAWTKGYRIGVLNAGVYWKHRSANWPSPTQKGKKTYHIRRYKELGYEELGVKSKKNELIGKQISV